MVAGDDAVTAWLATNIEGTTPPFVFTPIAGGNSNLTYDVEFGERFEYVEFGERFEYVEFGERFEYVDFEV